MWALDVDGGVWRWNGSAFEKIPGAILNLLLLSPSMLQHFKNNSLIHRYLITKYVRHLKSDPRP